MMPVLQISRSARSNLKQSNFGHRYSMIEQNPSRINSTLTKRKQVILSDSADNGSLFGKTIDASEDVFEGTVTSTPPIVPTTTHPSKKAKYQPSARRALFHKD